MRQIRTGLRVTVEFPRFLAILLGAAITPGLLSASNSTIILPTHTHNQESPR